MYALDAELHLHSCIQRRMKASLGHNVGMVGPHDHIQVIFVAEGPHESAMLAGHLPSLWFGSPSLATPSFLLRAKVQKHKQLTRLVLWQSSGMPPDALDIYIYKYDDRCLLLPCMLCIFAPCAYLDGARTF